MARLEGLLGAHEERRGVDVAAVLDALAFDDTDDGERLRRYQLAHGRTHFLALNTFFKVRREMARDPGDPATAPVASGAIDAVGPIDNVRDETNSHEPSAHPRPMKMEHDCAGSEPSKHDCLYLGHFSEEANSGGRARTVLAPG